MTSLSPCPRCGAAPVVEYPPIPRVAIACANCADLDDDVGVIGRTRAEAETEWESLASTWGDDD